MLNSIYTNPTVQKQVRQVFTTATPFPSITLYDVFDFETLSQLSQTMLRLDFQHEKKPLLHSYATASLPKELTKTISTTLLPFLSTVLNKKLSTISLTAYKLGWKDYQILHDSLQTSTSHEIIIDLTPTWSDAAGGAITYVDGSGEFVSVPIKSNNLTLVQQKKEVNRFIEYVNNKAKNHSRLFLLGKLE